MNVQQATKIVGNQPTWAIQNMVKALSMFVWLNTPKDTKRLKAAKIILQDRREVQQLRRNLVLFGNIEPND